MSVAVRRASRVRTALFALVVAVASVAGITPASGETELVVPSDVGDAIADLKEEKVYIVLMADDPVSAYDGDVRGLPATKPERGKLNPNSAAVKRYENYLVGKHDDALRAVGVGLENKVYDYTTSFNGFSAAMTGSDAAALRKDPGVLAVWEDELRHPTTDVSPALLEMDSIWTEGANGLLGEDVIVGVIDTGIWPEHPSVSDQGDLNSKPGKGNHKTIATTSSSALDTSHGLSAGSERCSQANICLRGTGTATGHTRQQPLPATPAWTLTC